MSEIQFAFDNPTQQKYIQIDEDGRFMLSSVRTTDEAYGSRLLNSIVKDENNRFFVESNHVWACIEAFDQPYVAEMVDKSSEGQWSILLPYGLKKTFALESLCLDEWDRFHGRCDNQIPFVLSRKAQAEFFDLVDAFDDDSITVDGRNYVLEPWLKDNPDALDEAFWSEIYKTEPQPKFDLGEPAKALRDITSQLKLNKMRVAVLGAGKGHDAAFFADQGHIVTAFDVSPNAIEEAKSRYGEKTNLTFIQADVLHKPEQYAGQFDLIFEHTLYCAIPPSRRNALIHTWRKMLADDGHVLGVFFAMDKRFGPPYGGSEWELRQRFKNHFDFTYWTRWKNSLPQRLGREVVIYMEKKKQKIETR